MRANLKKIRKRRSYTDEFKKELVNGFESGKFSVAQLEILYRTPPSNPITIESTHCQI